MPRSFQYDQAGAQDLDVFSIEPDGTVMTRYFAARSDGEGWRQLPLAGPRANAVGLTKTASVVGGGITVTRDFRGVKGRLDIFTDAVGGGIVHTFLIPANQAWKSEVL